LSLMDRAKFSAAMQAVPAAVDTWSWYDRASRRMPLYGRVPPDDPRYWQLAYGGGMY